MPAKRRGRDARHTTTRGTPPHTGRRFVENGRVRIEWREEGKRRRRTIGPDDAATRARADEALDAILLRLRSAQEAPMSEPQSEKPIGQLLRGAALRAIQAADDLVDWFRHPPEDGTAGPPEHEDPAEEPSDEGDR